MSRIPPIVCYHCGQDYAPNYWLACFRADKKRGDPFVCFSCRRDTNPDAMDAPEWTPPPAVESPARVQLVSESRKRCRMCGGEWDGLIFGPSADATKGSSAPLPFGICPTCSAADDARFAETQARLVPVGMPLPDLTRPRRVADE